MGQREIMLEDVQSNAYILLQYVRRLQYIWATFERGTCFVRLQIFVGDVTEEDEVVF
jgi:hypothetical protein